MITDDPPPPSVDGQRLLLTVLRDARSRRTDFPAGFALPSWCPAPG